MLVLLSLLSLSIWLYLFFFHGRYWHADQRLSSAPEDMKDWPDVCVVIPARNEEMTIRRTVRSLLKQDYPGSISITVVNDNSDDETAAEAVAAAETAQDQKKIEVIDGRPLEDGWVGKMWAVSQGIKATGACKYLLLTDADIEHDASSVRRLVCKAENDGLSLVSEMVILNCVSLWERVLIPAFVYFFQKLYPFPKVNKPDDRLAAAAGGSMLVNRQDLEVAGGIERIKDKVIDDCSLAAILKPVRPIWLGLSEQTRSIRPYDNLSPIWGMVARTAYVQLRFNPLLLLGTVISMFLIYIVPVAGFLGGLGAFDVACAAIGGLAWLMMWWTFLPTLELYNRSGVWGLALPIIALMYTGMTLDSARRHYLGRGGAWKGRTYADPGS